MSEYDEKHLQAILDGEGTWFNARLLRALNDLLPFADGPNTIKLRTMYREQCDALMRHYNRPSSFSRQVSNDPTEVASRLANDAAMTSD